MFCLKCNSENPDDAKYCFNCGSRLNQLKEIKSQNKFIDSLECKKCGAKVSLKDNYCEKCGTRVNTERKKYNKLVLISSIIELVVLALMLFICAIGVIAEIEDTNYGYTVYCDIYFSDTTIGDVMIFFMVILALILLSSCFVMFYPKIIKRILYITTFIVSMIFVVTVFAACMIEVNVLSFLLIVLFICTLIILVLNIIKFIISLRMDLKKKL